MRWLELTVDADAEAVDAVSEILGRVAEGTVVRPTRLVRDPNDELAVRADAAAPFEVVAHIPDGPAAADAVASTERALWHLQAFGLRPLGDLRVRSVEDDWTDGWRQHYVAQRIGRVVIVPTWLQAETGEGEVEVRLDPGMAFGTGLHPTTRGCLTLMQQAGPMPPAVLDVGCGSGILALAALRLGAGRAVAVDIDPLAVEATRANAAANGLGARMDVRRGGLDDAPGGPWQLIVANLVAALHVELAPRLAARTAPGGRLVAGGIIAPRGEEVAAAFEAAGYAVHTRLDEGEWLSLLLDRFPGSA